MPSPAARRSDSSAATVAARLFAASCFAVSGLVFASGCESESERADKDVQREVSNASAERGRRRISAPSSRVAVFVTPVDEALVMRDAAAAVQSPRY